VHSPSLCEVLYFPASHALQVPPLLVWPGLHVQSDCASLASGEFEFPVQSLQSPAPLLALYFPALHAVQVPDPLYPALHRQSELNVLPAGDVESLGHPLHVHGAVLERYVPALQSAHDGVDATVYVQSADVVTVLCPDACAIRSVTVPDGGTVYVLDALLANLCMLQDISGSEMIPCEPVPTDAIASIMYWLPVVPLTSVNPVSPAVSVPPHAIVLPPLASWT